MLSHKWHRFASPVNAVEETAAVRVRHGTSCFYANLAALYRILLAIGLSVCPSALAQNRKVTDAEVDRITKSAILIDP